MSYPLSSDVSAGQPTAAAHYNNLRADAIRFGQAAADAVNLGALLTRFEDNLVLEYLATNKVRVPASAGSPVALVVNGVPLQATAAVDLPANAVPSGAAAWWYVFAVQAAGSPSFTLTANTTATEAAGTRRIGSFYWDGSAITQLKTERRSFLEGLLGLKSGPACEGRLSLISGTPVTITDVSSATTLYLVPWRGNRVSLYFSGVGWKGYTFSQVSISLVGKTANKLNDVFLYDAGNGVLTLELVEWTNDTTRATALTALDGVFVKSTDLSHLYLGTIRINASGGQSEDTKVKRFVWNYFNRVERWLSRSEATQHTYNAAVFRYWNNDSNQKVELVVGVGEDAILFLYNGRLRTTSGTNALYAGIGLDALGANVLQMGNSNTNQMDQSMGAAILDPAAGYHYVSFWEYGESSPGIFVQYWAWVGLQG